MKVVMWIETDEGEGLSDRIEVTGIPDNLLSAKPSRFNDMRQTAAGESVQRAFTTIYAQAVGK